MFRAKGAGMKEINGYNLTDKKFEKLAECIYNTLVIIDYFVSNQPEIEELNNLAPIVANLKRDADILNAFFLDF